jgi:hypothetical protein
LYIYFNEDYHASPEEVPKVKNIDDDFEKRGDDVVIEERIPKYGVQASLSQSLKNQNIGL